MYCGFDGCWQTTPCVDHKVQLFESALDATPIDAVCLRGSEPLSVGSRESKEQGDEASDIDDDLCFLKTVLLEEFNTRTEASLDVMDCVNRYFDASNQAGNTELTELDLCTTCDGPRFLARCEIPPHLSMPKLSLASTSCAQCKAQQVRVIVGESKSQLTPTRITVSVSRVMDIERDVVKSEFARVEIPEIGLELSEGTLGGKYTTIKGLLKDIVEDISNSSVNFGGSQAKLEAFLENVRGLADVAEPWTLIITDDMGRSFVGGPSKGVTVTLNPDGDSSPGESGSDPGSA